VQIWEILFSHNPLGKFVRVVCEKNSKKRCFGRKLAKISPKCPLLGHFCRQRSTKQAPRRPSYRSTLQIYVVGQRLALETDSKSPKWPIWSVGAFGVNSAAVALRNAKSSIFVDVLHLIGILGHTIRPPPLAGMGWSQDSAAPRADSCTQSPLCRGLYTPLTPAVAKQPYNAESVGLHLKNWDRRAKMGFSPRQGTLLGARTNAPTRDIARLFGAPRGVTFDKMEKSPKVEKFVECV